MLLNNNSLSNLLSTQNEAMKTNRRADSKKVSPKEGKVYQMSGQIDLPYSQAWKYVWQREENSIISTSDPIMRSVGFKGFLCFIKRFLPQQIFLFSFDGVWIKDVKFMKIQFISMSIWVKYFSCEWIICTGRSFLSDSIKKGQRIRAWEFISCHWVCFCNTILIDNF